ncbi:MAG: MFS transporter [Rhodospirillales bacterium]
MSKQDLAADSGDAIGAAAKGVASGAEALAHSQGKRRQVLLAAGIGSFVLTVDMFVVTVALPRIATAFAAPPDLIGWVVAANALAQGVLTLAMGRLGDILGRKRVYMSGLALFLLGSIGCGLAQSIWQLIAFRALQGVAAASMWPGTLSLLVQAFPASQRGKAIGLSGGIAGIGLIIGPPLGGLLAQAESWRFVFFVNVPVVLAALWFTWRGVSESRDHTVPKTIDWGGVVLLTTALTLLLIGLRSGWTSSWLAPPTLVLLGGAVVFGLAFVWLESRLKHPLVEVSLFANRTFAIACGCAFLFYAANFGALPYLSLFTQNFLGYGPLEGGLAFIPATAPVAVMMLFGGTLAQRHADRIGVLFAISGICLMAAGIYLIFMLTPEHGYWLGLLPSYVVRGVGIGLMISATSYAAVTALPPEKSGLTSGTVSMARQVGTAFGVGLCAMAYNNALQSALPPAAAGNAPALAAAVRFHVAGPPDVPASLAPALGQAIVDGLIGMTVMTTAVFALVVALTSFIRRPKKPRLAPAQ